jgi:hypothetical protein
MQKLQEYPLTAIIDKENSKHTDKLGTIKKFTSNKCKWMQPKNHNYTSLSKRMILGKNYRPNVHFVRSSVDDIRTTPSVRIYPTNAQLPAYGFFNFLRVRAGKNPSARTLPVRLDTRKKILKKIWEKRENIIRFSVFNPQDP